MHLIQSLLVIFGIIAIGIICEKRKVLNTIQVEGFEIFLFKIAMPCYLFISILRHDLATLLNTQYICSYLLSFYAVAMVVLFCFRKDRTSTICIRILASGYVNAAIYALPVITFLLGDPIAAIIGNLLQVVVIQSIFIIILSFINHKEKSVLGRLLTAFTTPLVAMPIIGLLCNYLQFAPHAVITTIIQNLGNSASGIALFTFGLTLGGIKISKKNISKDLLLIVLIKNILHPIIAFCIGKYLFYLEGYWLYSLVIATAAPTAFVAYLIAKQFSIDQDLVRITVALTSISSLASLTFITLILG